MSNPDFADFARPRLLFFGMRCAFSAPPLAALLAAGHDLRALVLPALPGAPAARLRPADVRSSLRFPGVGSQPPSVDQIAAGASVPILELSDLTGVDSVETVAALRPEAIAVACFPWRLPRAVRTLPRLGCFNVHPSLLPRWRGPEPLFWTFRAGDEHTGTTVHLMDAGFDTGPIVRQAAIPVPDGIDGRALERELAELGGRLLAEAITEAAKGQLRAVPQDEAQATHARLPVDDDLVIRSDQPARRIYNLVCGIAPLWGPLPVHVIEAGRTFLVDHAVAYHESGGLDLPFEVDGEMLLVQARPGVVKLTLHAERRVLALTLQRPV